MVVPGGPCQHARCAAAFCRRRPGSPLLDAGCGTGGLLRRLAAAAPGRLQVGIDIFERAAAMARDKSGCAVAVASADRLPFRDDSSARSSASTSSAIAASIPPGRWPRRRRCLLPGGSLIINVPAYQWMASFHDREVHNARRFERAGLARLLTAAGFSRFRTTYWNSILFPLMVLRRKLLRRRARRKATSASSPGSPTGSSAASWRSSGPGCAWACAIPSAARCLPSQPNESGRCATMPCRS